MDFVTFEIAKKLKEKRFREKCFAIYSPYGGIFKFNEIDTDKVAPCDLNIKDFRKCYNCYKENNIDAPTISQVLKWLREEKKIALNIEFIPYVWQYKIIDMSFEGRFEPCGITLFEDYEEAALAGIEYTLDNLI